MTRAAVASVPLLLLQACTVAPAWPHHEPALRINLLATFSTFPLQSLNTAAAAGFALARSMADIIFCINGFPLILFFSPLFPPFIQPQKQNLRLATPRPGLLGRAAGTPLQLGQHEQQQGKTGLPHQVRGNIYSYEDQAKSYFSILNFKHHSECADYWRFLKAAC